MRLDPVNWVNDSFRMELAGRDSFLRTLNKHNKSERAWKCRSFFNLFRNDGHVHVYHREDNESPAQSQSRRTSPIDRIDLANDTRGQMVTISSRFRRSVVSSYLFG